MPCPPLSAIPVKKSKTQSTGSTIPNSQLLPTLLMGRRWFLRASRFTDTTPPLTHNFHKNLMPILVLPGKQVRWQDMEWGKLYKSEGPLCLQVEHLNLHQEDQAPEKRCAGVAPNMAALILCSQTIQSSKLLQKTMNSFIWLLLIQVQSSWVAKLRRSRTMDRMIPPLYPKLIMGVR